MTMSIHANLKDILSEVAVTAVVAGLSINAAHANDENVIVESHDILLLDVSSSMDTADIQASFQGVAQHYLSEEAMMNYRAGICTANTVIYYGTKPVRQQTHILCNEKDVRDFLVTNINEENLAAIRSLAGGNTDVAPALEDAMVVLAGEKEILKIDAMRHRVVLAGDENGGSTDILRVHSLTLSSRFGATVNAVAIGSEGVKTFFETALVTPPLTKHLVEERGQKRERPIAAGVATLALDSQQAGKAFQAILSLGGY